MVVAALAPCPRRGRSILASLDLYTSLVQSLHTYSLKLKRTSSRTQCRHRYLRAARNQMSSRRSRSLSDGPVYEHIWAEKRVSKLVSKQHSVEKGTEENGVNSLRSGSQKRLEQ